MARDILAAGARVLLAPLGLLVRTVEEERLERAIDAEMVRDLEDLTAEREAETARADQAEARAEALAVKLGEIVQGTGVEA